ncbi:MAG: glycoside hydrolase [Thalassobius sp.]|nr:glycoside hydrolase [Thalassovita sp.]
MKMKLSSICVLLAISMWYCTSTPAQITSTDFLKADGTVLRNNYGTGDTVMLRGTNLGSWLSMEYWMCPLGTGSLNRSQWVASASSTFYESNLQSVFDRDLDTRWSNGAAQLADSSQYFIVDMQENVIFNRVSFEAGSFTGDYARGYVIEVSEDSSSWETVATGTGTTENIFVQLSNIYYKRYVKITQTGTANENYWSIAEFNLYMEDDYSVRNSLILRFGEDGMDSLLNYYQETWITESDLDSIKSMGMNMVRVPFYWMEIMYNDGTIKPHGFDQLDWVVAECAERDMYVILDLHGAPGGLNGFITSGQAYANELWTDTTYQQMTIDIWKALATHFKDNPTVAAYDPMNEPFSSDQNTYPIHAFYNTLYQEIRAIDQDHIISIGAFPGFSYVVAPDYYGWENVLYQVHHYNEDKTNYDSQSGFIDAVLRDMANHQHIWNVPILAGEFNFWNFPDLWEKYLNGVNALNISWSNWAYKTKRTDSPIENWGYYDKNTNPSPDIHYDSFEDIASKWQQFTTPNFRRNTTLINTVSAQTADTITYPPYGNSIWLKGYNDTYLRSGGDGTPMSCNSSTYSTSGIFELVNAGDGKVAFMDFNGNYMSMNTETSQLICSSDSIGDSEKFTFINLGNGKMGLRGSNDLFVSAEDGYQPVICNRDYIDGWEVFEWGIIQMNVLSTETSILKSSIIYPNPTDEQLVIETELLDFTIDLFDTSGKILKSSIGKKGSAKMDVSDINAGIYYVKIYNVFHEISKRILIK